MLARIVLVVRDSRLRKRLRKAVEGPDSVVTELECAGDWIDSLRKQDCDLVLVERSSLPGAANEVAKAVDVVRGLRSRAELLVISDGEDDDERARLLAAGCMAIVSGKLSDDQLAEALERLVDKRREASEILRSTQGSTEQFSLGNFVSHSPSMRKFMKIAERLCQSDSTLLILGETGVGKERLARAIHSESRRSAGPFVVLNCGAVPESLLESELFGHEKGAFTGAIRAHRGHFEIAHRGTIFLDEIGEMPLHLQVKLLRVIQEKSIQRIGAEEQLEVDVRVMAATNRDLLAEMEEKRFRPDLYYRLSVVALEVPPLRERKEDIPALVESYFDDFKTQIPTKATCVAPEAMQVLNQYAWPGNIRELINVVERAVLLCDGHEITTEDFPSAIAGSVAPKTSASLIRLASEPLAELDKAWLSRSLAQSRRAWIAAFERAYLSGLLRETGGKVGQTASRANIDPRSLYSKMKQHGLRKEDFRE